MLKMSAFVTICLCLALLPSSALSESAPPLNPLFTSVLPGLAATSIPIRLPYLTPVLTAGTPLYASVGSVASTSYDVEVAYSPTCTGQTMCEYGRVYALQDTTPFDTGLALQVSTVALADGSSGTAVQPQCGGGCQPPFLVWNEGPYRYWLTWRVVNFPQDLVTIANSMNVYSATGSAATGALEH
jgi:hypothetical protein